MRAILLAAGPGVRLRPLTEDLPKCLVQIGRRSILDWQVGALRAAGIDDIVLVRGFGRSRLEPRGLRVVDNPAWATTDTVRSLMCALEELTGDVLILHANLVVSPSVLHRARNSSAAVGVVTAMEAPPDENGDALRVDATGRVLSPSSPSLTLETMEARALGVVRLSASGCLAVRALLEKAAREEKREGIVFGQRCDLDGANLADLLAGLIRNGHPVLSIPSAGECLSIATPEDVALAEAQLARGGLAGLSNVDLAHA